MSFTKLFLSLVLMFFIGQANAGGLKLTKEDCMDILERWAADPSSVSQQLVDTCKEMLAGEPADEPVTIASVEPCVGPDAARSVHCWGSWGGPALAAGAPVPVRIAGLGPDLRPEDASNFNRRIEGPTPPAQPPLPLRSCTPGASCGFATVVTSLIGQGPPDETNIVPFQLAQDGSNFTVNPGEAGEIASVMGMATRFNVVNGIENIRARGNQGQQASRLFARVFRDNANNIAQSADFWGHFNGNNTQSGFFAWGIATPQNQLDTLNRTNGGQGISISFAGRMSVNAQTNSAMTVNFGVQPNWTGNWTNPGYTFNAGGPVTVVDLVSDPAQFSANVQPDSVVQGAILGEIGNQAIAHFIDVNLQGVGNVKDVGLLREVVPPAVP